MLVRRDVSTVGPRSLLLEMTPRVALGMYRFVQAAAFFGPDSEAEMSALVRAQLAATLEDSGEGVTTMAAWCAHVAAELDQSEELAGFEIWAVLEDDEPTPRFTLLYFPDADSGLLFHAGTADVVGLALWPEGFKPKPPEIVVTNIDTEALSKAFATR